MPGARRRFSLVRVLEGGDLVIIRRVDFDGTEAVGLWSRVRLRKDNRCAVTLRELPTGSWAFSPAKGTEMFRSERISAEVVDRVAAQMAEDQRAAAEASR